MKRSDYRYDAREYVPLHINTEQALKAFLTGLQAPRTHRFIPRINNGLDNHIYSDEYVCKMIHGFTHVGYLHYRESKHISRSGFVGFRFGVTGMSLMWIKLVTCKDGYDRWVADKRANRELPIKANLVPSVRDNTTPVIIPAYRFRNSEYWLVEAVIFDQEINRSIYESNRTEFRMW